MVLDRLRLLGARPVEAPHGRCLRRRRRAPPPAGCAGTDLPPIEPSGPPAGSKPHRSSSLSRRPAASAPSPPCGGFDKLPGGGRLPDTGHRSSSLSRCPAGLGSSPRCGGLDKLDRRSFSPWLPGRVSRAGTGPPLIEPVETTRSLGAQPTCGGLDRLDRRWSAPSAGPAHRARRTTRSLGSQPTCGGLDKLGRGSPGSQDGPRSSSPSRCPSARLPALTLRGSRQARPAVAERVPPRPVEPGAGTGPPAHRARRDARSLASQPTLRGSRQARPAVVQSVAPGRVSRAGPGHRSSSLSR